MDRTKEMTPSFLSFFHFVVFLLNSLPNEKNFEMAKLKVFADNKINVAQMIVPVFDRIEKTSWEKGKMLVTSIFSNSHNVFKRLQSSWGSLSRNRVVKS